MPQTEILNFLFGNLRRRHCRDHEIPRNNLVFSLEESLLTQEDFEDWRLVNLEYVPNAPAAERVPFYDVRRLRTATSLKTRLPRVGFFSTNAFFENWMTNTDNQFRVVVNQSLLGGLHTRFSATEPTEPLRIDGVDGEHAENQDCMGCHARWTPCGYFAIIHTITNDLSATMVTPKSRGSSASLHILWKAQPRRDPVGSTTHCRASQIRICVGTKTCLFANSARCDANDPTVASVIAFETVGSILSRCSSSFFLSARHRQAPTLPR